MGVPNVVVSDQVSSTITAAGDFNDWSTDADAMQNVEGTDFYYLTKKFESDARLDYKFVIDGSNWILDPLNPNKVTGGYGANGEDSSTTGGEPTAGIDGGAGGDEVAFQATAPSRTVGRRRRRGRGLTSPPSTLAPSRGADTPEGESASTWQPPSRTAREHTSASSMTVRNPTLKSIARLARALGVRASVMVRRAEDQAEIKP